MFHLTPNMGVHVRQTDGQTSYFTPYVCIKVRQTDRQANNVSFNPKYGGPRKTDRETTFHLTPSVGVQVKRIDISFHPAYKGPSKTDG